MDEKPKIKVEIEEKVTYNLETLVTLLECILRKNVCDKTWVSIFSTLTKFERISLLSLDDFIGEENFSWLPSKTGKENLHFQRDSNFLVKFFH